MSDLVERLRRMNAQQGVEAADEIGRLRAEIAAAQKDAERYRYLRQVDRSEQWENLLMVRPIWGSEAIDAAIDAALKEGK